MIRVVRYLNRRNVRFVMKRRLSRPEYAECLRLIGSDSRKELANLASFEIFGNPIDDILDETEVDYRRALMSRPPLMPLAFLIGFCLAAEAWWPDSISTGAWGFALVLMATFLKQRSIRGVYWGDGLPKSVRRLMRRSRVCSVDFEYLVKTSIASVVNRKLDGVAGFERLVPHMEPALRNLDSSLLPIRALADIRDRVLERRGLVLGVTGSRGAGKTFALEYLRRFRPAIGECLFLRLPAPQTGADLGRFVLGALAAQFAGDVGPRLERRRRWLHFSGVVLAWLGSLTYLAAVLAAVAEARGLDSRVPAPAFILSWWSWAVMPADMVAYFWGLGAILATLGVFWFWKWLVTEFSRSLRTKYLAQDVLESLRFESERGTEIGMSGVAGVAASASQSRRGRPLEMGDVYATFEALVQSFAGVSRRRLLILIDELDRYGGGSDGATSLVEALNQIKPFLLVPGVSAVMAISSEAADQFRRELGPGEAGVLDSSFDEIVEIPPWSSGDVKYLLDGFVVGFNDQIMAEVSKISKGRPRDAMRAAWMICRMRAKKVPLELHSILERRGLPTRVPNAPRTERPGPLSWELCLEVVGEYFACPSSPTPSGKAV